MTATYFKIDEIDHLELELQYTTNKLHEWSEGLKSYTNLYPQLSPVEIKQMDTEEVRSLSAKVQALCSLIDLERKARGRYNFP